MRALIIYASHQGPTEWIARRIAFHLLQSGLPSDQHNILRQPADQIAANAYQAIVIGSPRQQGAADPRLSSWVEQNRWVLAERPTAIFFLDLDHATEVESASPGSPVSHLETLCYPWLEQSFPAERPCRPPRRLPRHLLHRFPLQWRSRATQEHAASFTDRGAVDAFSRRFVQQIRRSELPRWQRSTTTLAPPTARPHAYLPAAATDGRTDPGSVSYSYSAKRCS